MMSIPRSLAPFASFRPPFVSLVFWRALKLSIVILVLLFLFFGLYRQQQPEIRQVSVPSLLSAQPLWLPPLGQATRPQLASYNHQGLAENRVRTPLFIGFTRNQDVLEQCVLSYIAAGWARDDIIIVDNSGTMDANSKQQLSRDNPFFLDYALYRSRYGVGILQTPTLLSFAQLQNFYLRIALTESWPIFFWSHMDVVVLSDETASPYKSYYSRVLDVLHATRHSPAGDKWAVKFFAYDYLTLVNVEAARTIGQWDVFIPYYATDCDYYSRSGMHGYTKSGVSAGHVFDVSHTIHNFRTKLFPYDASEQPGSKRYHELKTELEAAQSYKNTVKDTMRGPYQDTRNSWQDKMKGGQGEPWTYDSKGFRDMWWHTAEDGRTRYARKWGTMECRLDAHGYTLEDEFAGVTENNG